MKTIDYLTGPAAALFLPAIVAAVAIAIPSAALSVFVVPKRMAFLGQGITHAAFGGVGVAAILGVGAEAGFAVVAAFCVLAALVIAAATGRRGMEPDTAIAVVLVASMALGAALVHVRLTNAGPTPMASGWESLLFGSIVAVSRADAAIAVGVAIVVLAALWRIRRGLLFWALDEPGAEAFGVPVGALRAALLTLCAITIVSAMKLAGVALVTALLVLPAATALRVTRRLGVALAISIAAALVGVLGGIVLAFETDLPAGPAIVGAQIGVFALVFALKPSVWGILRFCLRISKNRR